MHETNRCSANSLVAVGDENGLVHLLDSDTEILLKYLERDKDLLVYDKDTVKLRAMGEEKMITQEDSTIASLQLLISDLGAQIEALESRVDLFNKTAKEAVEKKNKTRALAALRSKKLAEGTLEKRHAMLAQLDEVFTKIEQASDQVELVRVCSVDRNRGQVD